MKKSISRWCLPGLKVDEVISIVSKAGFEAIEWPLDETGEFSLESSESDILKLKDACEKAGLKISSVATGLMWKYPLTSPDPNVRAKGLAIVKKEIEAAKLFGADTVLVVPGSVSLEVGYDEAWERAMTSIKDLSKFAEDNQVFIGIENVWNKFLLSPREMRMFVDEINSPYVGVYFDAGNVMQYGVPEDWARSLGKRIKKVHIKDFKTNPGGWLGFVNLLEGEMNWKRLMSTLKEIGYDGYIIPEVAGFNTCPETSAKIMSMQLDVIFS